MLDIHARRMPVVYHDQNRISGKVTIINDFRGGQWSWQESMRRYGQQMGWSQWTRTREHTKRRAKITSNNSLGTQPDI